MNLSVFLSKQLEIIDKIVSDKGFLLYINLYTHKLSQYIPDYRD